MAKEQLGGEHGRLLHFHSVHSIVALISGGLPILRRHGRLKQPSLAPLKILLLVTHSHPVSISHAGTWPSIGMGQQKLA